MYLTILALPFLSALTTGLLGRKLGVKGAHIVACSCLILSAILSLVAFYEVAICNSPVYFYLGNWIDSEILSVNWAFWFDSLTVSILIAVLVVSSLVHLYSTSYMENDPHQIRFFSYLSIFTFFIVILVTGDNLLVMFVGWEGKFFALDGYSMSILNILTYDSFKFKLNNQRSFHIESKIHSHKRQGPHDLGIIEIIIGTLLGAGHFEKRKGGVGTRLIIEQSGRNIEYLIWFYNYFAERGYCSKNKPKLFKRIKKQNKVFFSYKFNTFTFSSFNWLYDEFYNNGIKQLPINLLDQYLTPLSLAIWFIDDGSCFSGNRKGLRIATHCFEKSQLDLLCILLNQKYELELKIHKDKDKYSLYINHKTSKIFANLIEKYMLKSIRYKLGIYSQNKKSEVMFIQNSQ